MLLHFIYFYYFLLEIKLCMKHPNLIYQKSQEDFLKSCPEEEREYHARFFRMGNAMYIYHQQTAFTCEQRLREYYDEWLQGLPAPIAEDMKKKGGVNSAKIYSPSPVM